MISFPGAILKRFGRYEAIEDLGARLRGHFWRAWDPFLERYVLVAALPDLDPAELHRALQGFDGGLQQWLGEEDRGVVLDFGPSGPDHSAFFVFMWADGTDPQAADHRDRAPAVPVPVWAAGPLREGLTVGLVIVVVAILLVLLLFGVRSAFGMRTAAAGEAPASLDRGIWLGSRGGHAP